jgi:cytoskeleton protein RodZ
MMTETLQDISPQPEPNHAQPLVIGRLFIAAREQQGLSVVDVARQLRLGVKQIEALETDDYARLPGNTFARGFIRNYARLLQIDPEPLLQSFQQRGPSEELAMSAPPQGGEFSVYPSKRWIWYAGAAMLMMIAAPLLVYVFLSADGTQPAATAKRVRPAPLVATAPQQSQVTLPNPMPPLTAVVTPQPAIQLAQPAISLQQQADNVSMVTKPHTEGVPAGSGRIVFEFGQESWTEVRDKDGKKLLSRLNAAGTEQTIEGMPPFTLVVGNAENVKITYNGVQVDMTPYIEVTVARLTLK